jgi:hypothetical protein
MLTLAIAAAEQHSRFIKRIIEGGLVWALITDGNWVFSDSNEEEDKAVFTVWSDKAYAHRCAVAEWASYVPDSIPLVEFLESWCAGLHNNQELVGTNWDGELRGLEIEPLILVLEVLETLKLTDKALVLKKYANTSEFEAAVRRTLA